MDAAVATFKRSELCCQLLRPWPESPFIWTSTRSRRPRSAPRFLLPAQPPMVAHLEPAGDRPRLSGWLVRMAMVMAAEVSGGPEFA